MKIILTQEVSGLGAPGDIVEVKDGYGRNYLLPQGFAIAWTKGAEKQVTVIKRARGPRDPRPRPRQRGHSSRVKVNLKVRAGDGGRLFGSVTPAEIVDAVKAASGESVDKRTIAVANPIKTLGSHEISIRLHDEVSAAVSLNVVPA